MPKNDNPQALRFIDSMAKHGEQEAGEEFCAAHPLGKSADARKKAKWAKNLCAFLNERCDDEKVQAIRADCACGPSHGMCAKLKAVYDKEKDPSAFVEKINQQDLGFTLEYDGHSYFLSYPQCYCSCVKRMNEPLPKAWCYCTLGFTKRMFAFILEKEVQAELLSSIKLGDAVCRIKITA